MTATGHDIEWIDDDGNEDKASGSGAGESGADEHREEVRVARQPAPMERVTVRLPARNKAELDYWSELQEMSMSEYVVRAIENQVARDNGKVDNETLLTARLNQLIDLNVGVESRLGNVEQLVNQFMKMFSVLTSGETMLLDDEDGEL